MKYLNNVQDFVGGIGAASSYVAHKAEAIHYQLLVILTGCRINDALRSHISEQQIKAIGANAILRFGGTDHVIYDPKNVIPNKIAI